MKYRTDDDDDDNNNNNNNTLGVPVKNYEPQSRRPATSGVNPVSPPVKVC